MNRLSSTRLSTLAHEAIRLHRNRSNGARLGQTRRSAKNHFQYVSDVEAGNIRYLYTESNKNLTKSVWRTPPPAAGLPWTCPGCGAYSRADSINEPGYYSLARSSVAAYVHGESEKTRSSEDAELRILHQALGGADQELLLKLGIEPTHHDNPSKPGSYLVPLCDRCHTLIHHQKGRTITHPSLQSIADFLLESPYKYNHVYHVLDAADFPLSLIPQLHQFLSLSPQRGRNRRSKAEGYVEDRKFDMSFVITRSDLFAPRKEQVDAMMPTLVRMLRNALGPQGNRFRLGNVYCVSSQRGWWTKKLKADIWSRGSGGWMLGKVNVGKSSLFEAIFPKGRSKKVKSRLSSGQDGQDSEPEAQSKGLSDDHLHWLQSDPNLGATSGVGHLLPPAPQDEQYPTMPTVSNLPGTTVSPIRLPFGSGKGELIDLPGLARNNLNDMVYEESQASLFMQHRISARQYSIKRGQSLVVSNLIRITPNSEDLVFLACPFVPLDCHVTNTEKAVAILAQENHTAVKGIAKPGVQNIIASAGIFELRWDVTKIRTGPLTSHLDVKIPIQALPFVVYSLDLLIESVGWIELAVQVRKRNIEDQGAGFNRYPSVEVFSPSGKSVGVRPPLNTWVLGGHRRKPVSKRTKRPRQSKKGEKKRLKIEQRLLGRGG